MQFLFYLSKKKKQFCFVGIRIIIIDKEMETTNAYEMCCSCNKYQTELLQQEQPNESTKRKKKEVKLKNSIRMRKTESGHTAQKKRHSSETAHTWQMHAEYENCEINKNSSAIAVHQLSFFPRPSEVAAKANRQHIKSYKYVRASQISFCAPFLFRGMAPEVNLSHEGNTKKKKREEKQQEISSH